MLTGSHRPGPIAVGGTVFVLCVIVAAYYVAKVTLHCRRPHISVTPAASKNPSASASGGLFLARTLLHAGVA